MRVTKLNSSKEVLLKINKFRIIWDGKSRSKLQFRAKQLLKLYWFHYIVGEEVTIPGSRYKIDFINFSKRIAVEILGEQHNTFNKFFHNNSRNNYLAGIKRDLIKIDWCEKNHILVLELQEEDLDLFSPTYIFGKFGVNIV